MHNFDDRICDKCERTHIYLSCKNHPEKRWNTKNIDFIGARSIFYNLWYDPNMGPECPCSIKDLYHDHAVMKEWSKK